MASAPLSGPANATTNRLSLGSWSGTSEFYNGHVDEPAVYGAALSPAGVKAHYEAATAPPPPPATVPAPSGLNATARSSSAIDLSWTDNASDETGYVLERSTDSSFSSPRQIALPANATAYADSGLDASTAYHYRVKAVRDGTSSEWSRAASATTQSPPRLQVWVHENDVPLTRHPRQFAHERLRMRYFLTQFHAFPIVAAPLHNRAFWPPLIRDVQRYQDGRLPVPGSPRVTFTPGHTLGHCALHFPDRDAVIAGGTRSWRSTPTPPNEGRRSSPAGPPPTACATSPRSTPSRRPARLLF